jgi:two-component system chemotaxis response regulator CheB
VEGDAIHTHSGGRRDLVVIGASAGGVEVLLRLVRGLPADLRAAVCIVLHVSPGSRSMLAEILARAGRLPCRPARDGERLREGVILVARPDRHLVVEDSHVRLTAGPRENGHRPAIDVLFRSAAHALESRVVGVVLTGTRDDGAAGLAVIKAHGGAAIVQDPEEALYAGMPASALANVVADAIVPSALVASTVAAMVMGEDPPPEARAGDPDLAPRVGRRVSAACPECGGFLTERTESGMLLWECRVGHRYSPESVVDARAQRTEGAPWAAIRALAQSRRTARVHGSAGRPARADALGAPIRRRSEAASDPAEIVRQALAGATGMSLRRVIDGKDPPVGEEDGAA